MLQYCTLQAVGSGKINFESEVTINLMNSIIS